MNKSLIKIIAISIVIAFTLTTIASASPSELTNIHKKEITVVRYGVNGERTPIKVTIDVADGKSIDEATFNKCIELTKSDKEIQEFVKNNNASYKLSSFIASRGRGFHFKGKIRIPIKKQSFGKFPIFTKIIRLPFVVCIYYNDPLAFTMVKSTLSNETTSVFGNHTTIALGFIGYTGWLFHISKMGFIVRSGFAGYSVATMVKSS